MLRHFPPQLPKIPISRRKRFRTHILVACALLLLGTGNLLYGKYKYHEYRKLWVQATDRSGLPGLPRHILMFSPGSDITQEAQQIAKVKSRLDFYEVVVLGGQCFLVLSLVCVLLAFVTIHQPPPEQ